MVPGLYNVNIFLYECIYICMYVCVYIEVLVRAKKHFDFISSFGWKKQIYGGPWCVAYWYIYIHTYIHINTYTYMHKAKDLLLPPARPFKIRMLLHFSQRQHLLTHVICELVLYVCLYVCIHTYIQVCESEKNHFDFLRLLRVEETNP